LLAELRCRRRSLGDSLAGLDCLISLLLQVAKLVGDLLGTVLSLNGVDDDLDFFFRRHLYLAFSDDLTVVPYGRAVRRVTAGLQPSWLDGLS